MSLVLATILALAPATAGALPTTLAAHQQGVQPASRRPVQAATLASCSWDKPGHNPFMGDVVAAVDRYQDIPAPVRATLKARMAVRQYDEMVSIRRDAIVGRARYGAEIRDMYFGQGRVCGTVNRAAWAPTEQERGLVYCEAGHCILVPTVCRNVSRITRETPAVAGARSDTPSGASAGGGGDGAIGGGDAGAAPMAGVGAGGGAAPPGGHAAGLGADGGPSFADGSGHASAASQGSAAAATDATGPGPASPGPGAVSPGGPAGDTAPWITLAGGAAAGGQPGTSSPPYFGGGGGGLPASGTGGTSLPVTTPVPEPGSWLLMLAGLTGLGLRARHVGSRARREVQTQPGVAHPRPRRVSRA